jgi:hypothetical protein
MIYEKTNKNHITKKERQYEQINNSTITHSRD